MNELIKGIVLYAAGAVCGSALTWIFVKRKCTKEKDAEIEELRKYYDKKVEDVVYAMDDVKVTYVDEPKVEEEKKKSDERPKIKTARMNIDYTEFCKKHACNEHPEDDTPDKVQDNNYYMGLDATERMNKATTPYFIKEEDFGTDPSRSTMSLLYYMYDNTIAIEDNVDEEVIEDMNEVEDMIGDALTRYGFNSDNTPVIYIRNDARNVDYEITKVLSSYSDC